MHVWGCVCIEEFDFLGPKWQKHLEPWESLWNRKWNGALVPHQPVCWCKRSASQSRLSSSYQLAYTVKLGCSSVRNVLVLPWRSQGCPHPVMELRTSLRKTVLKDPLWLIYCRVLNMSVLFSTLCKTFIINRALKCRIHATFFLLRAAMVTSSSRTTGDSSSLWPLKHKKTRAQKDK